MKIYIYILCGCAIMYGISNVAASFSSVADVAGVVDSSPVKTVVNDRPKTERTSVGLVSVAYAQSVTGSDSVNKNVARSGAARVNAPVAQGSERSNAPVNPNVAAVKESQQIQTAVNKHEVTIEREVFAYSGAHKRDPFVSLLDSDDLRPLISEIRITTIAFDAHGGESVAILRNMETGEQYRVQVGESLGRMKVTRIDPRSVTFIHDELGYSRRETLALSDLKNKDTK